MEYIQGQTRTLGKIKCCDCDRLIEPNPTNMCAECLRKRVDITEPIPKQVVIYQCKGCNRFLNPPEQWVACELESRELLAFCLKKLKGLKQVHLVDATFIWTEPHSKRIKVKLTIQKEAFGVILQQEFQVEYIVNGHFCTDCHRTEAKSFWRCVVQLRQRAEHKKTFFYLEQLILKHNMHANCLNIKTANAGLDFYFAKRDDGRKMVDFLTSLVPCRTESSQKLVSQDVHNNTYDYKFTFSVEIAPVCKHDVVCLPLSVARAMGNIGQICICLRVKTTICLIDPKTLQFCEVTPSQYWRTPFHAIGSSRHLTEFTIMDIQEVSDSDRPTFAGQGKISNKHVLADAWVVRSSELGMDQDMTHTRTHLGHLLKPGDTALGLELSTTNVNNPEFNKLNKDNVPDVILLKKVYGDRTSRQRRRKWKLKHLEIEANSETSSANRDYEDFLEDLEEDPVLRQKVSIYKDAAKLSMPVDGDDVADDETPQIPLEDLMDDLVIEEEPMQ